VVTPSPLAVTAASSTTSSIGTGAPPAASGASGVDFCIGTPAGMSLPSASVPVKKEDKCISYYDHSSRSSIASEEYSPSTTVASGSGASVAGGSGTAWDAGVDSSAGGATSSATADKGSSPSQDRSVDFLQKHTQLVVSRHRLLQQVLLAKMQYLQVRTDYCHGRSAKDAGDID
jgi:hypothetical protein